MEEAGRIRFVRAKPRAALTLEDDAAARLVIAVQAGERDAFSALYELYFDRVYTYLRLALDDWHSAEDLAQQVFVDAFESIPSYTLGRSPFRAWLFRVARNRAISHLRKEKQVDLNANGQIDQLRDEEAPAELPVLGWISDSDLLVLVRRLPPAQRQVLALRYLFDLENAEVAEVLQRSPKTVRNLQHRALAFLRTRLTALGRVPTAERRQRSHRPVRGAPVICSRRFSLTSTGPNR